eukprot:159678-Lingulodinium_polyedra.AAC.1
MQRRSRERSVGAQFSVARRVFEGARVDRGLGLAAIGGAIAPLQRDVRPVLAQVLLRGVVCSSMLIAVAAGDGVSPCRSIRVLNASAMLKQSLRAVAEAVTA